MTKLEKICRNKHMVLSLWAVRYDGSEYSLGHINGMAEVKNFPTDVKEAVEAAHQDTSVERLEMYASRRLTGGSFRVIGRPLVVVPA